MNSIMKFLLNLFLNSPNLLTKIFFADLKFSENELKYLSFSYPYIPYKIPPEYLLFEMDDTQGAIGGSLSGSYSSKTSYEPSAVHYVSCNSQAKDSYLTQGDFNSSSGSVN